MSKEEYIYGPLCSPKPLCAWYFGAAELAEALSLASRESEGRAAEARVGLGGSSLRTPPARCGALKARLKVGNPKDDDESGVAKPFVGKELEM